MPRTNLDKQPNEKLKTLLWGRIKRDNAALEAAAKKLDMSLSTLSRRCKDPGSMTVDELLKFGRRFHVPIDELREALRY